MLVSPGIFNVFKKHGLEIAADDHVNFWYDSMNDCYQKQNVDRNDLRIC